MKLQLAKGIKAEVNRLNKLYGDEKSPNYERWYKMNKREHLIMDAMIYVEDGYTKNTFTKLDNWCKRSSGEFCDEYLIKKPNAVKQKLGKMIMEDIITIVE